MKTFIIPLLITILFPILLAHDFGKYKVEFSFDGYIVEERISNITDLEKELKQVSEEFGYKPDEIKLYTKNMVYVVEKDYEFKLDIYYKYALVKTVLVNNYHSAFVYIFNDIK